MYNISEQDIALIGSSPSVHNEFASKTQELDRRLQLNGMKYSQWDSLTDHQQEIFSQNLFLDGSCADDVDGYVQSAVSSCGCPDVLEALHHHSPALAQEIEKRQNEGPEVKISIGEAVSNLNDYIDMITENAHLSRAIAITEAGDNAPSMASSADKARKFVLSLPKFTPTEAWGDPNSMDRQQVQKIFSTVAGGGSIKGKLDFLKASIENPSGKISSPQRIIGTLILLESLSAVINSFSASAAGFVFEGFLAALFGGKQATERTAKGSLPIEDFIAFSEWEGTTNVPVSLKLLSKSTNIEGSYTNLVDGLDQFGVMVYIVTRKMGDEIVLEQFAFTRENLVDVLVGTRTVPVLKRIFTLQSAETGEDLDFSTSLKMLANAEPWEERYRLLQMTSGYSKKVREKDLAAKAALAAEPEEPEELENEEEPSATPEQATETKRYAVNDKRRPLEESKTSDGGVQWAISVTHLASIAKEAHYISLGTLPVSPERIVKVAESYMDKLSADLTSLFEATASLSDNINKYFSYGKRDDAISAGNEAIKDANIVASEVKKDISSKGEEPGAA
jgi:hypothetical protein